MGSSTSPKDFCVDVRSYAKGGGTCIEIIARFPDGKVLKSLLDIGVDDYGKRIKGVDALFISHAHEDHISGLKDGIKHFDGRIFCSEPTLRMLAISLSEKAIISSRKNCFLEGIKEISAKTVPVRPKTTIKPNKYFRVTFLNNAHILGASMIFLEFIFKGYQGINILYTGDFKNETFLFKTPTIPEEILKKPIHLVMESTRGKGKTIESNDFEEIVTNAVSSSKKVFILAKSRNQTQEVLKYLETLQYKGAVRKDCPIIVIGKKTKNYMDLYSNFLGAKYNPENIIFMEKPHKLKEVMEQYQNEIVIGNLYTQKAIKGMFSKIASDSGNVLVFLSGTLYRNYQENRDNTLSAEYFLTESFWNHADNEESVAFINQFEDLRSVLLMHGTTQALQGRQDFIKKSSPEKDVRILSNGRIMRLGSYQVLKEIQK